MPLKKHMYKIFLEVGAGQREEALPRREAPVIAAP